jgi:hypothetical protein
VPRFAAAAVALVGVLLVGIGVLQSGAVSRATAPSGRLDAPAGPPVISTAIGVLNLEGPRVTVRASAATATGTVFLGVGRARDVDAYLGDVSRVVVTGDDGQGRLVAERSGRQRSLPDPAGVDVWASAAQGQGAVSLVWPQTPGQWRLVAATDGASRGPTALQLSWSGVTKHSAVPALVAVGVLMLVGGVVTVGMLWSRERLVVEP